LTVMASIRAAIGLLGIQYGFRHLPEERDPNSNGAFRSTASGGMKLAIKTV
jgi:hypothetical protein